MILPIAPRPIVVLLALLTLLPLRAQAPARPEPFTPASLQPDQPAPAIQTTYTFLEEITAWANLRVFHLLLQANPDLIQASSDPFPFTLFAPTNDAFRTLLRVFRPDLPPDADSDTVFEGLFDTLSSIQGLRFRLVFIYHFVAGNFTEDDIVATGNLSSIIRTPILTPNYPLAIDDLDPIFTSRRLGRQISTTNGRFSFINHALIPAGLAASRDFRNEPVPIFTPEPDSPSEVPLFKPFRSRLNFLTARTDLIVLTTLAADSDALAAALSSEDLLHVFAPNDRAFFILTLALLPPAIRFSGEETRFPLLPDSPDEALGNFTEMAAFARRLATTWAMLEGVPPLDLVVAYHVLNTSKSVEELADAGEQSTLIGGDARLAITDTGVSDEDIDTEDASHIASYATLNGFVSIVDRVLLHFPLSTAIQAMAELLNQQPRPTEALEPGEETKPGKSMQAEATQEPEATQDPEGSSAIDTSEAAGTPAPEMSGTNETSSIDDEAVCFPAHASVQLANGRHKRMDELFGGDRIRVLRDMHSDVYLFTHRVHKRTARFVKVETDCGRSVTLTRSHYMYANGRLVSAGDVRVGEWLETVDGNCKVARVSKVVAQGLFAPHTMHGDLLVDGVRVSSYSTAVEPRLAHSALGFVRGLVRMGLKEPLNGWFDGGAPRLAAWLPSGYRRY